MAAPATHIILADKIYQKHFSNKNYSEFIVGTSFPDIRYLGVIDRSHTHFQNLSIEDIKKDSSFNVGMKLHSIVDEQRENFVKQKGLYDLFPESPLLTTSVKFFEDRVLYSKLDSWTNLLKSFNTICKEELEFGIKEDDIRDWHGFMIKYLSNQPSDDSIYEFIAAIKKPKEMAEEILRVVSGNKDLQKATEIVLDFYNEFINQ